MFGFFHWTGSDTVRTRCNKAIKAAIRRAQEPWSGSEAPLLQLGSQIANKPIMNPKQTTNNGILTSEQSGKIYQHLLTTGALSSLSALSSLVNRSRKPTVVPQSVKSHRKTPRSHHNSQARMLRFTDANLPPSSTSYAAMEGKWKLRRRQLNSRQELYVVCVDWNFQFG